MGKFRNFPSKVHTSEVKTMVIIILEKNSLQWHTIPAPGCGRSEDISPETCPWHQADDGWVWASSQKHSEEGFHKVISLQTCAKCCF